MFSKAIVTFTAILAAIAQVEAHAGVSPALGVSGDLARNDVQRPSSSSPCGNVNIAKNLDSSTVVKAASNGSFAATVTNFNGGQDGSRQMSVQIDADGTGKNFVKGTMLVNGNGDPSSTGSESLLVQMPSGTQCTGGTNKDLCLASFTSTAGFGNCVVVQQDASSASSATGSDNASSASSQAVTATSATSTSKAKATASTSEASTGTAANAAAASASASVVTDTVTVTVTTTPTPTAATSHVQVTTTVFVVAGGTASGSVPVASSTAFTQTITLRESSAAATATANAKRDVVQYKKDFKGRLGAAAAAVKGREVREEMFERMWASRRRA